jgi:hypothetical protein
MASLRELEFCKIELEKQKIEIADLKQKVEDIKVIIEKFNLNKDEQNKQQQNGIVKINYSNETNNDLSIIFCKYKQSLLVKNKYIDKNTTLKCKNLLKEIGAKWFKSDKCQGWLFVGLCKDNSISLQEISKFIVNKLEENNYNLDIEYL